MLLRLSLYVAAVNAASSFKAEILYPQDVSLTVYQNDAIIVRYNSEIPDNSLYTWCWDGGKAPTLSMPVPFDLYSHPREFELTNENHRGQDSRRSRV